VAWIFAPLPPTLLLMLTTMSAWLDFLITSGSAKWTAMAPVAAPMMLLLGISPEMTTAVKVTAALLATERRDRQRAPDAKEFVATSHRDR
jgi:hypothetical protein